MNNLNNKGYMLVEIIVAFTITMAMLFFIMNIVIKLKDINDDFYVETKLENDQLLMTKVVEKDLISMQLKKVDKIDNNNVKLTFKGQDKDIVKKVSIIKAGDVTTFQYGELKDDGSSYKEDSLYSKKIDSRLDVGSISLDIVNYDGVNNKLVISIPGITSYSDKDYGLNLNINYRNNDIVITQNSSYDVKFFVYKDGEKEKEWNKTVSCDSVECSLKLDNFNVNSGINVSGWYDNSGFTGTIFKPGDTIKIKSNSNFYASYSSDSGSGYVYFIGSDNKSINRVDKNYKNLITVNINSNTEGIITAFDVTDDYVYYITRKNYVYYINRRDKNLENYSVKQVPNVVSSLGVVEFAASKYYLYFPTAFSSTGDYGSRAYFIRFNYDSLNLNNQCESYENARVNSRIRSVDEYISLCGYDYVYVPDYYQRTFVASYDTDNVFYVTEMGGNEHTSNGVFSLNMMNSSFRVYSNNSSVGGAYETASNYQAYGNSICYYYSDRIYCIKYKNPYTSSGHSVSITETGCNRFTVNQDYVFCPNQRFDNVFNNSNLGNVALLERQNLNTYSYIIPSFEFKANSGK